ncbi:sulfate transport system permease protein [Lampropedia hyalina DSM 16112]|uniref:Sulfate transport system permease protein CysT n=1 Tax=Lampropedia hyalina DSM 16112 TaxID=1122156 RepID=A0A1M5BLM6_9BURK|nr:sulfate ABC transporter permease subunit CysT [Lampropedia hyalina]SHF43388.1 sulfate transport system permease protein [Lampropedia hyalina DSM 16112]
MSVDAPIAAPPGTRGGGRRKARVIPGFGLTLGYTLFYLSVIVLIPLATLLWNTFGMGWEQFWLAVASPRVLASYRLTFGASLLAALLNLGFGLLLAWVLVRYEFVGKKLVDALVDLPFALPTAVAGIALTALWAPNGWLGQAFSAQGLLGPLFGSEGLKIAFTPIGVVIALVFIGLPFVVRTVQPVLEELERELEEAAGSLGATRWQTFRYVIFPAIMPALLTGFAMAFARAIGEYGSVIFIAGNIPMVSEITPLVIIGKLEQYDYAGATAVALVMLLFSFLMLFVINALQAWQRRHAGGES